MLQLVSTNGIPIIASGVITTGWSNGMVVNLGLTVDPGKVGLVYNGFFSGASYYVAGQLYLHSPSAFTIYFGNIPTYSERVAWKLLDLSCVLRPGEAVQRGRTSLNCSSTNAWTNKTITLGTALGKYQSAYCNLPHFGYSFNFRTDYYIAIAYPTITSSTSLSLSLFELTYGSSLPYYVSWEVWPLKD